MKARKWIIFITLVAIGFSGELISQMTGGDAFDYMDLYLTLLILLRMIGD